MYIGMEGDVCCFGVCLMVGWSVGKDIVGIVGLMDEGGVKRERERDMGDE